MAIVNLEEYKYHKNIVEQVPMLIEKLEKQKQDLFTYREFPTVRDLIYSTIETKLHFEKLLLHSEGYINAKAISDK